MHTIINVDETVPKMVWFTSAATHDHILLDKLTMNKDTIYVFDKGYNDYTAFKRFSDNETGFVTRIKDNAVYNIEEELAIDENIHFVKFLENPEKDWQRKKAKPPEPNLFNQPTLLF